MQNLLRLVNMSAQGPDPRVLCCCTAGMLRSPTCANVLHEKWGHNTRAVGLVAECALIPINEALVHWAHEVVVMTLDHFRMLELFVKNMENPLNRPLPVRILNIPDNFNYGETVLKRHIFEAYTSTGTINIGKEHINLEDDTEL